MPLTQELREAMSRRHPDAVCLGGICYFRLDGRLLVKAEPISNGGCYSGVQLTVLNRYTGPVDSLTIRSWDLPRSTKKSDCSETESWDVCHPTLNIDALSELAEEYLRLFREPEPE